MSPDHSRSRRNRGTVLGRSLTATFGVAALWLAAAGSPIGAQQLKRNLCPAGAPFRIRPFAFNAFAPGSPGTPMLRRTLAVPGAVCNDGSPAVMYIRPADAVYPPSPNPPPPSDDWLIFFDGGGGCRDADSCLLTRWCSQGGEIFDQAGKMSSRGAPVAIREVPGIWMRTPPGNLVNQFAGWNQVLVHYCSSDNWSGSAQHRGLSTSTGVNFDIRLEGEAIVNAVFATLLAGPTASDPAGGEFYADPLPDLSNAGRVLIGGESAGTGIIHHLDRIRDLLLVANPAMDVRGVLDAGFNPQWSEYFIDWSDTSSPGDYEDYLRTEVEPVTRTFRGTNNSAMDQSCLDALLWQTAHETMVTSDPFGTTTVGLHPQDCHDGGYVRFNHLTTPVFVRHDINDPLTRDTYITWNALLPPDYWNEQYNLLNQLVTGVPFAPLEAPALPPGVQGTHCNKHVTIQTTNGFFRDRVSGLGARSFHDLLVNWLNGVGPTVQIEPDPNPADNVYPASVCF